MVIKGKPSEIRLQMKLLSKLKIKLKWLIEYDNYIGLNM